MPKNFLSNGYAETKSLFFCLISFIAFLDYWSAAASLLASCSSFIDQLQQLRCTTRSLGHGSTVIRPEEAKNRRWAGVMISPSRKQK
jgi:hypothetical protein